MVLVDTGVLVAWADANEASHAECVTALKRLRSTPLRTTLPVLTETFHMLGPGSRSATVVRELVRRGAVSVWFLDRPAVDRAFELMEQYGDQPMDLADASIVVAAEMLATRRVLTLDVNDFETYRIKRGHRHVKFELVEIS